MDKSQSIHEAQESVNESPEKEGNCNQEQFPYISYRYTDRRNAEPSWPVRLIRLCTVGRVGFVIRKVEEPMDGFDNQGFKHQN